jgi:hypothetical protein
MNQYDVLRYLIRGQGHASPQQERDLLLTVDATEQGYADLESYKEVLAQKAREDAAALQATIAGPQAPADVTAGLTAEQLQAELDRRAALTKAQTAPTGVTTPPATPIPTS